MNRAEAFLHRLVRWRGALCLLLLIPALAGARQLDRRIPPIPGISSLEAWLRAGETEEIDWDVTVRKRLRMDQRLEIALRVEVRGGDLEPEDSDHDLILWSWITTSEGRLLDLSDPVVQSVTAELPDRARLDFEQRVFVVPGEYELWLLLHDAVTGMHSLSRERVEVDEVDDEPFPQAFSRLPIAQFPRMDPRTGENGVAGDLLMPVDNARPLDLEVVAALGAPEQWTFGNAGQRHSYNVLSALIALSQLDLARGSLSVIGVDLARRQVTFEQEDLEHLDSPRLMAALDEANAPAISVAALAGRRDNPAFLREFVEERLENAASASGPDAPLRVFLFLTPTTWFADDSDLTPVTLQEGCNCVAFLIRLRASAREYSDEIEKILKPFDPRTFNVLTPGDLRKAMGKIVEDLERL